MPRVSELFSYFSNHKIYPHVTYTHRYCRISLFYLFLF